MTPDEILRDLRDIHLPDQAVNTANAGLVLWPAGLVIAVGLLAVWIAWRRRSTWRREIVRELDAIERGAGEGHVLQAWTEFAALLRRVALLLCERQEVAGLIGDAWLEKLDRLFGTNTFSSGPGRGITIFPYGDTVERDREELERVAGQLKSTIDDVRKHLPSLKVAR